MQSLARKLKITTSPEVWSAWRSKRSACPSPSARKDLDAAERDKLSSCAACRYDHVCEGIWKNYAKRYGWSEVTPVSPVSGEPTRP